MNRKGFTLIELLIVVAIISILAGIVLVGLRPSLNQSRDTRRAAELHQIQTGLQLYFNRYGLYPSSLGDLGAMLRIPNDPNDTPYYYTSDGNVYVLGAKLEGERSASLNGSHFGTGGSLSNGGAGPDISCDAVDVYCLTF
ncbi:MAG: type II secretion system protein [Patescibacteria group bacterium]